MYFDAIATFLVSRPPVARLGVFHTVDVRRLLTMVLFAMTGLCRPAAAQPAVALPSHHDLQVSVTEGDQHTYRAVLEVQGKLLWKGAQTDEGSAPLDLQGELLYGERILQSRQTAAGPAIDAVRYYRKAQVKYRIGNQNRTGTLSEHQRLLTARLENQRLVIASPQEPLTREDLDLIDVPGCSLGLPYLLPAEPLAIGESWTVSGETLAVLLGLSAVDTSSVDGRFASLNSDVAVVEFSGDVAGKADGSRTTIQLEAKANVNLKTHTLTWFTATIREQRQISDTQPGLDVTARLRLVAERNAEPIAELVDAALPAEVLTATASGELARVISKDGGFELLCDRRWRVIVDRRDVMVLRLFEDEQLIGQLVVTSLPDGPPGKHQSLATLLEDVQKSITPHAGQVVESAEGQGDAGLRVLRVSAAGVVSEISMQWVYYHLSNDEGRRAGLAFTYQTDLLEKFADRDRAMAESFQFRARDDAQPASAEATPATSDATGDTSIQ